MRQTSTIRIGPVAKHPELEFSEWRELTAKKGDLFRCVCACVGAVWEGRLRQDLTFRSQARRINRTSGLS